MLISQSQFHTIMTGLKIQKGLKNQKKSDKPEKPGKPSTSIPPSIHIRVIYNGSVKNAPFAHGSFISGNAGSQTNSIGQV